MLFNKSRIFLVLTSLFLSSCDFRVPQEWETPSWEFDLLIPLINESYSMASIADGSNDVNITIPDSTHFIIELKEEVIDSGYVKTEESFFIISENDLDFSLQNFIVPNPNPAPNFSSSQEMLLSDLISDSDLIEGGKCFTTDLDFLDEDIEDTVDETIDSLCDDFSNVECLNQINWIKIDQGTNILNITNNFPFKINEFRLIVSSNEEEIINNYLTDIDEQETRSSNLFHKDLGCEIESSIYFRVDNDLELKSDYQECDLYNQDTCEQLGYIWQNDECLLPVIIDSVVCDELGYTWQNNQCIEIIPDINDEISCNLLPGDPNWDGNNCFYIIEMNEVFCLEAIDGSWQNNECYIVCTSNEACCNSIEGTWNGNECINLPSGVWISGDENLIISNTMNIDSFESLNADIECTIDTTYSVELPVDENIALIEGHVSNINDIDTNRIAFDLTNNFFTDITFEMFSDNLFDLNNERLYSSQTVLQGESFEDIIISEHTIKNEDGGSVELLSIGYSAIVEQDSAIINFDESYGLVGDGAVSKTVKLDELKINLNEFSTSGIDLGTMPSGFEDFELPFLKFNFYVYNQISANMKLYLDLFGISDDDTLKIHVEPDIQFLSELNPYSDTDSLIISFVQDSMFSQHTGNIPIVHDDPIIEIMDHDITDLFSYDFIDISGYAILDGDATLIPLKSLWADIEIIISPLTIVIKDGNIFSFVAGEFSELSIMDRSTASKIDSGLVSTTLNMNMNNQVPFGGNLLMYISNSPDYFPLCIDSLSIGDLDSQVVDSACIQNIQDYLACNTLDVIYDSTSNFVKHLDCISDNYNYYYENLLNIDFDSPNLDSIGIVLDSIITHQSVILEDEINYFTRDSSQYLIPRFVFDSDLDTITFQPANMLTINSHLILKLITSGLLEE